MTRNNTMNKVHVGPIVRLNYSSCWSRIQTYLARQRHKSCRQTLCSS